jgi:hypothetical protein
MVGWSNDALHTAAFVANINSLVLDYVVRQKIGGTNLNPFIIEQLPVLQPRAYREEDLNFLGNRVVELTHTAEDTKSFARDLGYNEKPFPWNDTRRAKLRAELDGYYAHLYGLTRDELQYILDPKDVFGSAFPSETFRVLKEREESEYGEYRTRRLVLEAFDTLAESPRFREDMFKRESALEIAKKEVQAIGS